MLELDSGGRSSNSLAAGQEHVIRARGADFQVGGLRRTRKREPTRGFGGLLRRENLKYYSSEMASNASRLTLS